MLRLLGAGGMGEVFLAHDEHLNRKVALKRLRTSSDTLPGRSARFHREAKIAARFQHPAIVQVYEWVSDGENVCIVMEYVEGEDLRHRIAAAPLSLHEALAIGRQIALAMAEAHDRGIIHRDLKSENVLITRSGHVKITDFGIAKDLAEDTLTAEGHVMGTYRSMSPEQALGRPVDHRSDLFSFGVLLYESLAGRSPFRAETPFLTLHRVVNVSPRPLRNLRPGLPAALCALIDQLLEKDPLLRPRDFHEVAQALAEIQGDIHGKPCTRTPPAGLPPLDIGGDTLATADPGPTPASGAAPVQGRGDETETLTPEARPAAGLLDAGDTAQMSETESLPEAMQPLLVAPPPPAASMVIGQADKASGANASSAPVPSARLVLPRARSRGVAALAVTGAALALGLGYVIWRETSALAPRLRVAIPRPRVEAPAALPEADLMAVAVRIAIVRGLLSLDGIDALPLDDVDQVVDGYERERKRQPLQRELMHAVGADELIAASLECTLQSCRISLQRIAGGSISGEPASFEMSIGEVGGLDQPVIAHLSRLFPDQDFRDRAEIVRVEPEDYQAFLRLRKAYWESQDDLTTDEALAELAAIRERSQGFLELYRFEAELLLHKYRQTNDRSVLERALERIREAERQAPDAYDILVSRFQIALEAGELDLAQDALHRLDALDPGSGSTLLMHGQWYAHRGDRKEKEKALEILERAAARDSSWRILYRLAFVEQELQRWDAAHAHLVELLERSPGNYAGLSMMAHVELARHDPACAARLYGELVARRQYYEECNNLGVAQMVLGRYQEASESFRCALSIRPDDPGASFNLAEALKLSGHEQLARERFQKLLESARQERNRTRASLMREAQVLAHLAASEPALAHEARELTEGMMTRSSESQQFAYPAAVVHALLGDRDQAIEHVRTLLRQGAPPYWFQFPWFDGVREHPEMRQRLAYAPPARPCE